MGSGVAGGAAQAQSLRRREKGRKLGVRESLWCVSGEVQMGCNEVQVGCREEK